MEVRRTDAAAVRPLRRAVLRPHADDAELAYPGDDDPDAGHYAAWDDAGGVAGIGSVTREPMPGTDEPGAWRLRGMATAPGTRGTGLGAAVLAACVDHLAAHGGTRLWCNARTGAIGFYERYGWGVVSGEFDVPGIGPHVVMTRSVP